MTYRPLPDSLTIKSSEIEGLGLFAVEDIPEGTPLGIPHVADEGCGNGYIRTPLGGFFNLSDTPNCKAAIQQYEHRSVIVLMTLRDIKAGEEITAHYWLYDLS